MGQQPPQGYAQAVSSTCTFLCFKSTSRCYFVAFYRVKVEVVTQHNRTGYLVQPWVTPMLLEEEVNILPRTRPL